MKEIYKKIIISALIITNCTSILVGCITGASKITTSSNAIIENRLESLKEKGVLSIVSGNDKPFSYLDPQTEMPTGLDVDILTEAARRLGINKIEMKTIPLKYAIDELNNNNNVDILATGLYITDERKKEVLFTNIWYKEPESILILKSSKFNSMESLKNSVVGAQSGTIELELAQKWKKDSLVKDIKIYQNQSELVLALLSKEIDSAVLDSAIASYILSKYESLNFTLLPSYKPELSGIVAGALRKDDTLLADAINAKVDEMKEDGTLLNILKNYGLDENNFVSVQEGHVSDN